MEKSGATYYVFAFKETRESSPELFEEKQEEFNNQISEEKKSALLSAWMEHLKRRAEITTNNQLL